MDINFIIAQAFGVLGMISSICSMQFKKRRSILAALFCLNLFAALSMIFLGSLSATYISFLAVIEILINHFFESRKKPVPGFVVGLYALATIAIGIATYAAPTDLIAIACAFIFCITILAKKEQDIRKLTLVNQSLWLIFNVFVGAYALVCSNTLTIISTALALLRYRKTHTHAKIKKTKGKHDKRPSSKSKR